MKRDLFLSILFLPLLAAPAAAQITFDPSILESLVDQRVEIAAYTMDTQDIPNLTPILNATGGEQTYDFSSFTFFGPSSFVYDVLPSAAGTPGEGDPHFSGANYVQSQNTGGDFYVYYALRDDGYFILGSILVQTTDSDGNGVLDQTISKNSPPDPIYRFPLTAESTWSETLVSTSEASGATSQVTRTKDAVVEGWGTLVTPAGSAEALRLRVTSTTESGGTSLTTSELLFVTNGPFGVAIIFDAAGAVQPGGIVYSVTSGISTNAEDIPERALQLRQNYPNPFGGDTRIPFELERPEHVTLDVFDLLGRRVTTLVDEPRTAGPHAVVWAADQVPNGMYIYRLRTGSRVETRRMLLLR